MRPPVAPPKRSWGSFFVLGDFETANPVLDLKEVGAAKYAKHWATEILCFVFGYNRSAPFVWRPDYREHDEYLRSLAADPDVIFVRHGDFEYYIWHEIMVLEFGFPPIPIERWEDTQVTCTIKSLPVALEDALRVLRLPGKDMEGSKHTIELSKFGKNGMLDRSGKAIQRTVEYCISDYWGELALLDKIAFMPAEHRPYFHGHQRMTQRGIKLDLDYVAACRQVAEDAKGPLLKEFRELTTCDAFPKGLKPTQREKV